MAAKSMDDIAKWLSNLRFRKKLFGGVDERDVWLQLEQLQKEYRAAFDAQEERWKALLAERDAVIVQLKSQAETGSAGGGSSGRND